MPRSTPIRGFACGSAPATPRLHCRRTPYPEPHFLDGVAAAAVGESQGQGLLLGQRNRRSIGGAGTCGGHQRNHPVEHTDGLAGGPD